MPRRRKSAPPSVRPLPAPPRPGSAIVCGLAIVAVVVVPALFNPHGQAAFGVVKASLLQVLGLLAGAVAALTAWPERRRLRPPALVIAGGVVVSAFAIATAAGVAPALSFYGPGVRSEGLYVLLALGAIAFAMSTLNVAETDAVVTAMIVGSIGPSLFAIAQLLLMDRSAVDASLPRAGSTLGNPILFAGYLVTVIPLTAAMAFAARRRPSESTTSAWRAAGLGTVLLLQLAALAATRAKGGALALVAAAVVAVIASVDLTSRRRRVAASIVAACIAASVVGGAAWLQQRYGTLVVGRTLQVRVVIWRDVIHLIASNRGRLAIGYGPELLQSMIAPFYTPDLGALEGTFSIPDRAHNDLLDTIVAAGLIGAAAVIVTHILLWTNLVALLRLKTYAPSTPSHWLALGLLGSAVAHFVDIQTGIATTSSRLTWWCCLGIVAARVRAARRGEADDGSEDQGTVAWLAGGVSVAALVFDFWQANAALSGSAVLVIAGAVVMTAVLATAWRPRSRGVAFDVRAGAAAAAIVVSMLAGLVAWDALAPGNGSGSGLLAAIGWTAHEATACLIFFTVVAIAIGARLTPGAAAAFDARRAMTFGVAAAIAVALVISAARPARADVLARIGEDLASVGRWVDAGLVEEQRVLLTPESDRAWAALGGMDLEIAQHVAAPERPPWFRRTAGALAEARRRNPFDWMHIRNQASAERVWAAADKDGRAEHLAAADGFFREASARAPAFPRLWAEWGNVDAERGDVPGAFAKLDRAAVLQGSYDAKLVADAIFLATGIDIHAAEGRVRAAAALNRQGFHALAKMYGP